MTLYTWIEYELIEVSPKRFTVIACIRVSLTNVSVHVRNPVYPNKTMQSDRCLCHSSTARMRSLVPDTPLQWQRMWSGISSSTKKKRPTISSIDQKAHAFSELAMSDQQTPLRFIQLFGSDFERRYYSTRPLSLDVDPELELWHCLRKNIRSFKLIRGL